MAVMEAYFDESGTDDSARFLVVSGYLFDKGKAIALDAEWRKMLDKYRLPHFHMVECAHGAGIFKHLSIDERIAAQTEAINLIKSHAAIGMACSVDLEDFPKIPTGGLFESPYTFACWQSLMGARHWAEENNYQGAIAYFFEAGHRHQSEANGLMDLLAKEPSLKLQYHYESHAFILKRKNAAIQCADILAWQWYTQTKKIEANLPMRRDLASLADLPHNVVHYDKEKIDAFIKQGEYRRKLEFLKASIIPGYWMYRDYLRPRYFDPQNPAKRHGQK